MTGPMPATDRREADRIERRVMRHVTLRLIPFMFLLYIVAYLDRINVGFAALQMNADLNLSHTVFGLGGGIFFIGYFLFEIPSNLILHRVGARLWIARIMISWGIAAAAMMFVSGPEQLLRPPLSPRPGRGGILPRHDPLPHLLVPRQTSGTQRGPVHDGHAAGGRHWRTRVRRPCSKCMDFGEYRAGSGCSSWKACRQSFLASSFCFICPTDPKRQDGSRQRKKSGCRKDSLQMEQAKRMKRKKISYRP